MKILVTATNEGPDAPVDPRFGRAAVFMLHDTETGAYEAHANTQNLNAAQGAGIQAAQAAERLGAEVVLTGHCGPKAFRVLQAASIPVALGASGTVAEAVAAYQAGELNAADSPDVEGHWV